MEIDIKNLDYSQYFKNINVHLDHNKIIGIMGKNYEVFLNLLGNEDINCKGITYDGSTLNEEKGRKIGFLSKKQSFYTNSVYAELLIYLNRSVKKISNINKAMEQSLIIMGLDKDIIKKKISELSSGYKQLLKMALVISYDPSVIIIDEPFFNLDNIGQKKVLTAFHNLKNKHNKTIIIGSSDSNIIYSLCDKVLFLKNNELLYDDVITIFRSEKVEEFDVCVPDLVKFTNLALAKGINLWYHKDIRDLIKDVYRHV